VSGSNPDGTAPRLGPSVSIDPRLFSLVSAACLLEHRSRFESSRIQVYLVHEKRENVLEAKLVSIEGVAQLAGEGRSDREFAIPTGWSEGSLDHSSEASSDDAFYTRWNALMEMPLSERVRELGKGREAFEKKLHETTDPKEQGKLVGEVTQLAYLVNRASLSVNPGTLTPEDRVLAQETLAIVQSVIDLIAGSKESTLLFQTLENASNGQVLQHTVRVFSTMVAFLVYFNDQHTRGLSRRVRSVFHTRYRRHYEAWLPELKASLVTSDNLVRFSPISAPKLRSFALGTLMHDIGKILDLDYFENGAAYDQTRIRQHSIIGSGLFQRVYGLQFEDARYIVGDHHNYLFHKDGYGLTRWDRARRGGPSVAVGCAVTDTLESFHSGEALGFFPVEACAIIDVYDALTDSSRLYKRAMTPGQAVAFMDDHFCASHKLDPIVFGLFIEFLRARGTQLPPEFGLFAPGP